MIQCKTFIKAMPRCYSFGEIFKNKTTISIRLFSIQLKFHAILFCIQRKRKIHQQQQQSVYEWDNSRLKYHQNLKVTLNVVFDVGINQKYVEKRMLLRFFLISSATNALVCVVCLLQVHKWFYHIFVVVASFLYSLDLW